MQKYKIQGRNMSRTAPLEISRTKKNAISKVGNTTMKESPRTKALGVTSLDLRTER